MPLLSRAMCNSSCGNARSGVGVQAQVVHTPKCIIRAWHYCCCVPWWLPIYDCSTTVCSFRTGLTSTLEGDMRYVVGCIVGLGVGAMKHPNGVGTRSQSIATESVLLTARCDCGELFSCQGHQPSLTKRQPCVVQAGYQNINSSTVELT